MDFSLKIGDLAPDFKCLDSEGVERCLNDYKGKKLLIFFYPRANTPGCTAEACNLRDNFEELKNHTIEILGVSADGSKSQKKFRDKFEFPYPLLCDTEKIMINNYGVWGPKKFMGKAYEGIHRTSFLIDENSKIESIITKVKTKDHASQILEK